MESTEKVKRRVGRPLKFETLEILQTAIDDYFACTVEADWLITGLAVHLNTSRETLMEYEDRPEYVDAIKAAKDKVQMAYERDLRSKGNAGSIFGLKNFGWTDRTEVAAEHTSPDGSMTPKGTVDKSQLDDIIASLKDKTAKEAE